MAVRINYATREEAEAFIREQEGKGLRLIRMVDHFDEHYLEFEEVIIIPPELTMEIKT